MELSEITIGQNIKEVKKQVGMSKNLTMGALPTFIMSDYRVIQDLDTCEEIFIKTDDKGIIIDITDDFKNITDLRRAEKNIKEILDNNGF